MNKQLETLRARAALVGVVLVESRNDKEQPVYVGTREALTQELASLEAVSAWLDRVAGPEPVLAGAGGHDA
jgi:hypothetical protein